MFADFQQAKSLKDDLNLVEILANIRDEPRSLVIGQIVSQYSE